MLRCATDIALTKDARNNYVVTRVRMVLGSGWPAHVRPVQPVAPSGMQAETSVRSVMGAHGKYISTVDRVLEYDTMSPADATADGARRLVESLRKRCREEDWDDVKNKVRVFTPDGALDGQLAGVIAGETFNGMICVLRCVAHIAASAMKRGWEHDPLREIVTRAQFVFVDGSVPNIRLTSRH